MLTVAEVFRLASAVPPRFRALVLLAMFGSLWWGEPAALRRCHLDLDARTVRIEASVAEMKTGELITGRPKSDAGTRVVTVLAREWEMTPETIKARIGKSSLTWAFVMRAGDGNRTRAVSLGSLYHTWPLSWGSADLRGSASVARDSP